MLYIRTIVHVFVPFITIIVLNVCILYRLRRQSVWGIQNILRYILTEFLEENFFRWMTVIDRSVLNDRREQKAAAIMLIVVIASYMTTQLFNVAVTCWEFIDVVGFGPG